VIHYESDRVTVHHGDCLDVLRELDDNSVDAVCTDPPYGLSFMSKEWDRFAAEGRGSKVRQRRAREVTPTGEGHSTSAGPYLAAGVDDTRQGGHAFQSWCQLWAAECLRVLKPGGHLLAFGGTRTWHRLACAIEDAGFEVRDSLAWMYGSGFPKSLDVSKAIDKRAEVNQETRRRIALVAEVIRTHREAKGMERAEVSLAVVGTPSGACWNWEHQQLPSVEMWPAIKATLNIPDRFDGLIEGDREQFIAAEREVIGTRAGSRLAVAPGQGMDRGAVDLDVTTPATPDAARWQGWGTALKPGWESVVVARKSLPLLARIGSHLDDLGDECRQLASGAAPSSAPTRHDSPEARTATAPESAATRPEGESARVTPTGAAAGSPEATGTSWSEWQATTCLSIVTSWRRSLAVLSQPTSTSTTGTTSETTIDLTTLWSSLSQITEPNTLLSETSPDGLSFHARIVDDLFGAALLNWRATQTLTATGPATSATRPDSLVGGGPRLDLITLARKPLTGTVASNVLAWGTGALNVDGCRVGTTDVLKAGGPLTRLPGETRPPGHHGMHSAGAPNTYESNPAGRWPANVLLDHEAAAMLDEQSGERAGGAFPTAQKSHDASSFSVTGGALSPPRQMGDSGGASRFFYTAKAGSDERPRANGVAHPTVKPLDLMRWLVRLVTPPGGIVLEPFAGSGATVEACILEGFRCVAIEREADYLPLIMQRIHRQTDPVAHHELTKDDDAEPSLFDLLGGDAA
jgi:DNA modification methylase